MKKLLLIGLTLLTLFTLSACSKNDTASDDLEKITVVATLEPHATILDACKPLLKEKGYDLDVVVVDDYYIPNRSVNDGEADANYFQHIPFFEAEVKNNAASLIGSADRVMKDFEGKIDEADKTKLEEQKAALQKAIDENKATDELKKLSEELQQTMFGISQKAYEAVQKDGANAQSANSENASSNESSNNNNDDDVIDAEYTKE